jgi:hypothetical protein
MSFLSQGSTMTQEELNDAMWHSLPTWRKEQLIAERVREQAQKQGGIVMPYNRLEYGSEEVCSHCDHTFTTGTILSICPACGKQVVSCNACARAPECGDCEDASCFWDGIGIDPQGEDYG